MKHICRMLSMIFIIAIIFCICTAGAITASAEGKKLTVEEVLKLREEVNTKIFSIFNDGTDRFDMKNYDNHITRYIDIIKQNRDYSRLNEKYQNWFAWTELLNNTFTPDMVKYFLSSRIIIENDDDVWCENQQFVSMGNDSLWYTKDFKIIEYPDDVFYVYQKRILEYSFWGNSQYRLINVFKYDAEKDKFLFAYIPFDSDGLNFVGYDFYDGIAGQSREPVMGDLNAIPKNSEFCKYDKINKIADLIQISFNINNYLNTTELLPHIHQPNPELQWMTISETEEKTIDGKTYDVVINNGWFNGDRTLYEDYSNTLYEIFNDDLAKKYLENNAVIQIEPKEDSIKSDLAVLHGKKGKFYDFNDENFSFKIIKSTDNMDVVRLSIPEYDNDGKLLKINRSLMVIKDGKIAYEEYNGLYGDVDISALDIENPDTSDININIICFISSAVVLYFLLNKNLKIQMKNSEMKNMNLIKI